MKFLVTRTSNWDDGGKNIREVPPVTGAVRATSETDWYEWEVEVDSLEAFLDMLSSSKENETVIAKMSDGTWGLEIYNGYRE